MNNLEFENEDYGYMVKQNLIQVVNILKPRLNNEESRVIEKSLENISFAINRMEDILIKNLRTLDERINQNEVLLDET